MNRTTLHRLKPQEFESPAIIRAMETFDLEISKNLILHLLPMASNLKQQLMP